MKPTGGKNYGSIPHLSNSKLGDGDHFISIGQERIITKQKRDKNDVIFAFEKYDGSNVGIAKINGRIYALTKSGYEASTSPYRQHHIFSNWVDIRQNIFRELLNEGERITGEWLAQAHGLKYDIEGYPIVFFDMFSSKNNRLPNSVFTDKLAFFNLPIVRKLHEGDPVEVHNLIHELNKRTPGIYSIDSPEGIVFRVERKGEVDFLAKWVRSDFENGKYCIGVEEKDLLWNI